MKRGKLKCVPVADEIIPALGPKSGGKSALTTVVCYV